jgi:DNA-binding XRE family transcriptional regulator
MSITSEEREFFISRLRKEQGISQTQLAERLGVS